MKKVFYTFALLTVVLTSCNSTSDDIADLPDNSIVPTKVEIVNSEGDTETIQFTYSGMTLIKYESSEGYYADYVYEDNKLTHINNYDTEDDDILETYTYDTQDRVATIKTNIVSVGIYEYSLSYNADNSVITSTSITFPDDEVSTTTISNGNVTNENDSGEYSTTFTYDTANAPFKNINNRAILLSISSEGNVNSSFSLNNALIMDTAHSSDSENITNSYTYTTFNYPRTVTENYDGDISTYTYTYNND